MDQALALSSSVPQMVDPLDDFDLQELRIFDNIPSDPDYGIVAMHGVVVVYDRKPIHVEGIVAGAFYVRESQTPPGRRRWNDWLQDENNRDRQGAGPQVPLVTRREVVRAVRWPRGEGDDNWAVRLSSGFTDGPYYDWWFGRDFVGKVVGVYRPRTS